MAGYMSVIDGHLSPSCGGFVWGPVQVLRDWLGASAYHFARVNACRFILALVSSIAFPNTISFFNPRAHVLASLLRGH
eukprot:contig_26713_g6571